MMDVETQKAVLPDAPKQWPLQGLGDAITLALITAAAYVGAFGYEAGLCLHFGIPIGLVRISTEVLISSLLPVLGFAVVLVLWLEPLALPFAAQERRARRGGPVIIVHVAAGAIAIILFLAFGYSSQGLATLLFLVLLVDGAMAFFACLAFAWRKWGMEKWPRVSATLSETASSTPRPLGVISRYMRFRHVVIIFFLPLCFTVGALSGLRNSRVWDTFYAIPSKGIIIVRDYGDVHVCKPVSEVADTVGPGTILLTTADISKLLITSHKFSRPPTVQIR
jgi:hypothetical protein